MAETTSQNQDQCQFYLERKKRLCRFRPRPGEQYCPEHACVLGIQSTRKRIPCPLNPKHNCYENDLQNHLKKCPVTKRLEATAKLDFYVKDINIGSVCKDEIEFSKLNQSVKELRDERLREIITKVNSLYNECMDDIEVLHLEHEAIKEFIARDSDASLVDTLKDQAIFKKELLQQASLVGQLDNLGFLTNDHCFVELGAGKGKLSHWIQIASKSCTGNSFVLVDRSSVRYKMDSYHKGDGDDGKFHRIKIDIKDLCLGKVPEIQSKSSVVVIGKHLCGGATDMGIRCAVDTLAFGRDQITRSSSKGGDTQSDSIEMTTSSSISTEQNMIRYAAAEKISNETNAIKEGTRNLNSCSNDLEGSNMALTNEGANHTLENDESPLAKSKDCVRNSVLDSEKNLKYDGSPPAKVSKTEATTSHTCTPEGIMIALCCHHRCTWDTYVGRDFMRAKGIGSEEFDILTRLSSWATCARVSLKARTKAPCDETKAKDGNDVKSNKPIAGQINESKDPDDQYDHDVEDLISTTLEGGNSLRENISVVQKEEIGRKCKRIIDMGRINFLKSKGMTCLLREYVDVRQTPENIVLIATGTPGISPLHDNL